MFDCPLIRVSFRQLSNCLLRRTSDARKDWHCFVSALVAGPFIYLNPNNSLALYVMWKALESSYNEAVKSNLIQHRSIYPSLLYSMATAHLFYTVCVSKLIEWLNRQINGQTC